MAEEWINEMEELPGEIIQNTTESDTELGTTKEKLKNEAGLWNFTLDML